MADVRPFRAIRPRDDLAAAIIAPPYDVLSDAEARAEATRADSFVHITRAEVDLPLDADAHGAVTYARARQNLDAWRADGRLVLEDAPTFYLYGQVMGEHRQVGVLAACSVDEYDRGIIKKHEHTRPDKEDDRTLHMEALDAQVGLVFLAHRAHAGLAAIVAQATQDPPSWRVTTDDAVEHALWVCPQALVAPIQAAFAELPALYVADGHHRSAAASRVFATRQDDASSTFIVGLFPDNALQVLAYNRVVHDLNGHTTAQFLQAVRENFQIDPGESTPDQRGVFSMYLDGAWYRLRPRPGIVDPSDVVASLDASVLQDHLLAPILGIADPRRSDRITFVGGIRGAAALAGPVDQGKAAVAFHLFPTGLDQLFDVADAGHVMPPKSTWFEPKLREGVAIRSLAASDN